MASMFVVRRLVSVVVRRVLFVRGVSCLLLFVV